MSGDTNSRRRRRRYGDDHSNTPNQRRRLDIEPNIPIFNTSAARRKLLLIGTFITKDDVIQLNSNNPDPAILNAREELRMRINTNLNENLSRLHDEIKQATETNNQRLLRDLTFQRDIINMVYGICNGVYSDAVIYRMLIFGVTSATYFTVEHVMNQSINVEDAVTDYIRRIENYITTAQNNPEISQETKDEIRLLGKQVSAVMQFYTELFRIEPVVRQIEFKLRSYDGLNEAERAALKGALESIIRVVSKYISNFNLFPYTRNEPYYIRFTNVLTNCRAALDVLEQHRIPKLDEYITPLENGEPDTTLTPETEGFDMIGHYNEPVLGFLNEDPINNIAFKSQGGTYILLSRPALNMILANKNANVRHKCRVLNSINTNNVDIVPYVSLRALGFTGGIVQLGLLRSIILDTNIRIVDVVRLGPPENTASLVSHGIMTTLTPNLFSAAHCQEGQLEDEYTMINITPPNMITPLLTGGGRTRRRRRHRRRRHHKKRFRTRRIRANKI